MALKRFTVLAVAIAGLAAIPPESVRKLSADEEQAAVPEARTGSVNWMQIKLNSSQQALEGLALADFKKIEEHSRRLLVLNILENWMRDSALTRKSEYQEQMNAFEYAAKELRRNAQYEDIDGALASYQLLTKSCVECHKVLRDVPQAMP